ncbi:MAG: TVP38/TMEM64 family protein [Asticcacaulis sp.]
MLKALKDVWPHGRTEVARPFSPALTVSKPGRVLLLAVILGLVIMLDLALGHWAGLDRLKGLLGPLAVLEKAAPLRFAAIFFLVNLAVTALCIPIEILFGLAAGALFGFAEGALIVSFASSIGATLAFLMSRFLARDHIRKSFPRQLAMIDRGVARDGAFYVFSVRLLPLFPFALTNVLMGLTDIPVRKFYLFSQLGMLPATLIYVNAGTQLSRIDSLAGIVSPSLIGALVLLGVFPWLAKGVINLWQRRRSPL